MKIQDYNGSILVTNVTNCKLIDRKYERYVNDEETAISDTMTQPYSIPMKCTQEQFKETFTEAEKIFWDSFYQIVSKTLLSALTLEALIYVGYSYKEMAIIFEEIEKHYISK